MDDYDYEEGLNLPAGLSISPRGTKIAYHLRTKIKVDTILEDDKDEKDEKEEPKEPTWKYVSSIWVADVGKPHSARRITDGADGSADDYAPKWFPDPKEEILIFLSNRGGEKDCNGYSKYGLCRLKLGDDGGDDADTEPDTEPVVFPSLSSHSIRQFAFDRRVGVQGVLYVSQTSSRRWRQHHAHVHSLQKFEERRIVSRPRGCDGLVTAVEPRLDRPGWTVPSKPVTPVTVRAARPKELLPTYNGNLRDVVYILRKWCTPEWEPTEGQDQEQAQEQTQEQTQQDQVQYNWLWLGGEGFPPRPVGLVTGFKSMPCPIVDVAWVGRQIYLLESSGSRSIIHSLDHIEKYRYKTTAVYGTGIGQDGKDGKDGKGDRHVVSINSLYLDMLVHTRGDDGDRLHFFVDGRTIWHKKGIIREVVAIRTERKEEGNRVRVRIVVMVMQDGRILQITVPDEAGDETEDEAKDRINNPQVVVLVEP